MQSFNPLDYVTITLFGLNYQGRVLERITTASGELYLVEYAQGGDIKSGRFRDDELKGAKPSGSAIAMSAPEITGNANEIADAVVAVFRGKRKQ